MKRVLIAAVLVVVAFIGAATLLLTSASAAEASCHYYCKNGQALSRMKTYMYWQCHKWDKPLSKTACVSLSNNAAPPKNTRIYYESSTQFRGYGWYVYGYFGFPKSCQLVRIWEGLSKVDGHLWRIATETTNHSC